MKRPASYAIIPAAGHSRRMGDAHKLLLPWHDGTVIDHVLRMWTSSRADHVVVVVRADDSELQAACQCWPVELVLPEIDPPDMRTSVWRGLQHIEQCFQPSAADRWLVAPADMPSLSTEIVDQVISAGERTERVVVPKFGTRSGHPASFPWELKSTVAEIPADQGLNWLMANHVVEWLDLAEECLPEDIDTPRDYIRLRPIRGKTMDGLTD